LDALLKENNPKGDVPDAQGYSLFPGNINVLIFALEPFKENLIKTKGLVPEFINPKYADAAKTKFKSPTRLECMMQDYPRLLGPFAKVGFTAFERWVSFSPVKNNLVDAAKKVEADIAPESASSGEFDIYTANTKYLSMAGVVIEEPVQVKFANIPLQLGPRIVLAPSFAVTFGEVKYKVKGGEISNKSTLVLEGKDITIEDLELNGTLLIKAVSGAKVKIVSLAVENKGWEFVPLQASENVPPYLQIRGYRLVKHEQKELNFNKPGEYIIDESVNK